MLLVLAGCGGDSTPSNNETGGTEITPPSVIPSSETIQAMDFHLTFDINTKVSSINVNFSTFVSSTEGKSLSLTNVAPLTKDNQCQVLEIQSSLIQFTISPKTAKTCSYRYTVTDGETFENAIGRVTITSKKRESTERGASLSTTDLPLVSKSAVVGDSLTFSLASELSGELSKMTNPLFSEAIIANGTGIPTISETGDVIYKAISAGSAVVYFYILDDQNTIEKGDDIVYNGTLIINVSGNSNTPPSAQDVEIEEIIPASSEAILDLTDLSSFGSIIGDSDGDDVQLVVVHVENAFVSLLKPNDVNNTSFKFRAEKFGTYRINYVIYDHEDNGVSSGVITLHVGYSRGGKFIHLNSGIVKLFNDGHVGVYTLPARNRVFESLVQPLIGPKKVTDIKAVAQYIVQLELEDGKGILFVLSDYNSTIAAENNYYMMYDSNELLFPAVISSNKHLENVNVQRYTFYFDRKTQKVGVFSPATSSGVISWYADAVAALPHFDDITNILMLNSADFVLNKKDGSSIVCLADSSDRKYNCEQSKINNIKWFYRARNNNLIIDNTGTIYGTYSAINGKSATKIKNSNMLTALLLDNKQLVLVNSLLGTINTYDNVYDFFLGGDYLLYVENTSEKLVKGDSFEHNVSWKTGDSLHNLQIDMSTLNNSNLAFNDIRQIRTAASSAIIIKRNQEALLLNHNGLRKIPGNYIQAISDIEVHWNAGDSSKIEYIKNPPFYAGVNQFLLRAEDQSYIGITGIEVPQLQEQCNKDNSFNMKTIITSDESSYIFPFIGNNCAIYLFKDNSAILSRDSSVMSQTPKGDFDDSIFSFPIPDLDNDGISNSVEENTCQKTLFSTTPCLSATQVDSDGDGVKDIFELTKNPNRLAAFRNYNNMGNYSDYFNDVNFNGVLDGDE